MNPKTGVIDPALRKTPFVLIMIAPVWFEEKGGPHNRKKKVKKGHNRTFRWKTLKSWLAGYILKKEGVFSVEVLSCLLTFLCLFPEKERANCKDVAL